MLLLVIVFVKLLAAFCATEKTFEKKLFPGVAGFSGVGVSGGKVVLDSLLGPMFDADPDRARRCDNVTPEGDAVVFGMDLREAGEPRPALPLREDESVGVGGVLTMTGPADSEGGVRGGLGLSFLVRLSD